MVSNAPRSLPLSLTAEELHQLDFALRREWLVTNGIGGYASASVAGANMRSYHGLLVAALKPPVGRAVLLSKLEESLILTPVADLTGAASDCEPDTAAAKESQTFDLPVNLYPDGVVYPRGDESLISWENVPAPTWVWSPAPGVEIEKRITMAQGENTTFVSYRLLACPHGFIATLRIVPLLAWRDYHSEMRATDIVPSCRWEAATGRPEASPSVPVSETGTAPTPKADTPDALRIALPVIAGVTNSPQELILRIMREDGRACAETVFQNGGWWYYRFQHPRERERGQNYQEDLYAPGTITVPLSLHTPLLVAASAVAAPLLSRHSETNEEPEPASNTAQEWVALESLGLPPVGGQHNSGAGQGIVPSPANTSLSGNGNVSAARNGHSRHSATEADTDFEMRLRAAAQQFLVGAPGVRATIIAGYPWFADWGRDTMIALPGLCLTTGEAEHARAILTAYAEYVDGGMLPNRFPDAGTTPEYNTVDATLWYFNAVYHYVSATGDISILRETLWPVLEQIVAAHEQGTRYGIKVDSADSLLAAGEPGVQLTWMDAKVGSWVVTPRIGKPVEINALWYNALRIMANFAEELGQEEARSRYAEKADRARESFKARFVRPDGEGLYDVLDTPEGGPDGAIRPNQIFAISLPFAPLEPNAPESASVLKVIESDLRTPVGLRTLSPRDSRYRGRYEGDGVNRDGAYHQGTVWPWLLGAYAEAHFKVYGDWETAKAILRPLDAQMGAYGMGSLAEVYDGDAPQRPNGCVAQAWSIGETLRVWNLLAEQKPAGGAQEAPATPTSA